MTSINQKINFDNPLNIEIFIKREDLLHPIISGNKIRKLNYNIKKTILNDCEGIITFGGAYSNHIVASAYAAKINNLKSVGIIRGEELANKPLNDTLKLAQSFGMSFEFLTRENYRFKNSLESTLNFNQKYPNHFIIPEGGTNLLAVKGCEEILTKDDKNFDYICTAVGTGGTISGLINSSHNGQVVIGFPALVENYLEKEIEKYVSKNNWHLIRNYHFDGYAKVNEHLIKFLNEFYNQYRIPLDPIYTGKMMYGIMRLIEKNYFNENSKILVIHTGGLQGIKGINQKLNKNSQELLNYDDKI